MRTLLLALLIALLPIRGWLGDAMAVGMATHAVVAAAQQAPADHGAIDHANCPEHVTPAHGAHGDCAKCAACDVCHSVALSRHVAPFLPAAAQATPVPTPGAAFASAEPQRGDKPPIA